MLQQTDDLPAPVHWDLNTTQKASHRFYIQYRTSFLTLQFQLCTGEGVIIQTTLMQTQHNLGLLCKPIQLQGQKILLSFLLTIELAFLSMLLREMFYQKVTLP